jgi:hypothetical protein
MINKYLKTVKTDVTGGSGAVASGEGTSGADGAAGQSKIVAWNTILW